LALLFIVPQAEAKRRESEEEIARKTRHYSGWEYGASARVSLVFYDMDYMRIKGEKGVDAYKSQAKMGGNVMLNAGYFFDNHWRLGVEAGAQIQYNYTFVPISVTGHYFYGERKNCLFNFVNLGTNLLINSGMRAGATGAGGVGIRIQTPDSKTKYEITLGYQALMMRPRPDDSGQFGYLNDDVTRSKLDQSVFIGLGVFF
jgi:hypothetical protein